MPSASARPRTELARVAGEEGAAARAAQLALGEGPVASRLQAAILALAQHRSPAGSICPSDAARAVGEDNWRELTSQSRDIAIGLARAGDVQILQGGVVRDPDGLLRGPIRIRAAGENP
jgi:hypothetical protein